MNTNPNAKRILCYGDSNTQGIIPGDLGRYPANVRWTGVLQDELGADYEVIEEGLWGRTTNLDDPFEDKNGKTYSQGIIRTHLPLDFIILWLGTNNLKKIFKGKPEKVALGLEDLILEIKKHVAASKRGFQQPKILVVSPPILAAKVVEVKPHFEGAPNKSKDLGKEFMKIAKKNYCKFIDLENYISVSAVDGIHLEKESHAKIGKMFAEVIRNMETK